MLGIKGRGIRWYVVVSWGGTGLDRTRKVGADAEALWTCVCSRYGLLKCTLLDDRPYTVPVAARVMLEMIYPNTVTSVNPDRTHQ